MQLEVVPLALPLPLLRTGVNHITYAPLAWLTARRWLRDRFDGVAAPDTCG